MLVITKMCMAKICFSQINACNDFKTWLLHFGGFYLDFILSVFCVQLKTDLVNSCRNEASLFFSGRVLFSMKHNDGCGRNAFTKWWSPSAENITGHQVRYGSNTFAVEEETNRGGRKGEWRRTWSASKPKCPSEVVFRLGWKFLVQRNDELKDVTKNRNIKVPGEM